MKCVSTCIRFCRLCLLLTLFLLSQSIIGKEKFKDHIEFSYGFGITKFVGTLNMYGGDFLHLYRDDGNKIGMVFSPEIRYYFNDVFAVDLHCALANMSGTITYKGDPTGTDVTVAPGTKRPYKTVMYNIIPMANFNLLRVINSDSRSDKSLMVRMGVGISYCDIRKHPFDPVEELYNFSNSSRWFVTGGGGVIFQKELTNGWSCFGSFMIFSSATSKVDAYYVGSEPVNEGLPTNGNNGKIRAVDTHSYITFGVSYSINKNRPHYKPSSTSRSRLHKKKKYRGSPWIK